MRLASFSLLRGYAAHQEHRRHETLLISLISALTLPSNANRIMPAFVVTLRGKKMRGSGERAFGGEETRKERKGRERNAEEKGDRKCARTREKAKEGERVSEKKITRSRENRRRWRERGKYRRGKRPQILFQVKGFLSRHLPRSRAAENKNDLAESLSHGSLVGRTSRLGERASISAPLLHFPSFLSTYAPR